MLRDGKISLYRPEIALIKEFNTILRRDRGSHNDSTGRKKFFAFKEFHYIYMVADYDSYPNIHGLNEKSTDAYARKEAELPDDWRPDKKVKVAIARYRSLQDNVAKKATKELYMLFRSSLSRVKNLRLSLDKLMDREDLSLEEIERLHELLDKTFKMAANIPVQIEALRLAIENINKMEHKGQEIRGGGIIPDSANPETTL